MKTSKPLTSSYIEGLRPKKGQSRWVDFSDGGCRGLTIRVSPRGEKVWQFRALVSGQRRSYKIGGYPEVSLASARKRAEELRSAAADGITGEALETRKIAQTRTVDTAYTDYIEAKKAELADRTIKEKRRLYGLHISTVIGSKVIGRVSKADVAQVVDAVRRKGLVVQSNRILSEVQAFLNWCADRDYLETVPQVRGLKAKEQPRERTLTEAELGALWNITKDLGPVGGAYIRTLVLLGQRRDEVRLMTWDEVDLKQALWTIPKERYKTKRDHIVPLSASAVELLRGISNQHQGFVFKGRELDKPFNGTRGVIESVRRRLGKSHDYTLHDIRRTFRTWLSRAGVDEVTAERCLGHEPQGITRVYDRYDRLKERQDAFTRWSAHILEVAEATQQTSDAT